VADVLRAAGADPVFAVGGDLDGLRDEGIDAIGEPRPGAGPLSGIVAALATAGDRDVVVVLACDLVGAASAAVTAVVDALRAAPGAMVAVPVVAGRAQPLHAAWRPSAGEALAAALESEDRAVRRVLEHLPTVTVEHLDAAWFRNANTPADAAAAGVGHTGSMSDAAVPEIDVAALAERHAAGAYVLDVRRPDEYEEGHVPGAVLIPLDQLEGRRSEIPADRPLLVICRSGARSARAVEALNAAGFDAINVAGGTLAWIDAGQPVVEGAMPG
jgi:rhodanese-related sulfurtransferase/molybdopterin-guanine dinucleotide biosynthesis protein A